MNPYNMLSAEDIDNAIKLGSDIVSCQNLDIFKDDILKDITRYLGADTGTLLAFSTQKKMNIGFNCSYGVSSIMHKDYVNGYFEKDPAVTLLFNENSKQYLGCARVSKVILLEDYIDYNDFTSGIFYNSFLRPLNIHHLLLMKIALNQDDDNDLLIGMHRPKESSRFSEINMAKARMLVPALTGAMANLSSRALIKERQSIIQSLGEDMNSVGLMILNDKMEIIYQSSLFRKHFNQTHKDIPQASLPPEIFQACTDLRSNISPMDDSLHRQIFFNDQSLTCDIKAVATENPNGSLRFIIYSSIEDDFRVNDQVMRQNMLTDREKDLACQITLGLTNIQIAEKLGISIRTVENHLCAIYAKMNVQNRTSLTHVLSQGYKR